jgi:hypothetical protein
VWKRNGHDHFAIFSLISVRMVGMGTRTFFEKICKNCSAVTIETTPFRISLPGVSIKTKKHWYAVPYPSSFHWCEGIKEYPWTAAATHTQRLSPQHDNNDSLLRNMFAMFIGSVDMTTPRSTQLRRQLYKDCKKHKGEHKQTPGSYGN